MKRALALLLAAAIFGAMSVSGQGTATEQSAPQAAQPTVAAEAAASVDGACSDTSVSIQNDRFEGTKTIETKADVRAALERPILVFRAIWGGKTPLIGLDVMRASPRWRYLDCPLVAMLADGKKVELGSALHDGSITGSGSVIEMLILHPSEEAARQIGTAQQIEYRVCNDEYKASDAEVCAIRHWWKAVQAEGGAK